MFSNLALSNRVKRKQIDALVSADPSIIIINRSEFAPDGAGGKVRVAPVTLPAQIGKLIGRSAAVQLPFRATEDGRSVQASFIMVMGRKADVRKSDKFMLHGLEHEILFVHEDRDIRTVCEVVVNA